MKLRDNVGRRAKEDQREIARRWVQIYEAAAAAPDKGVCLNPEDGPDEQTWMDVDQATSMLVHLLKTFAESGSFIDNDTKQRFVLPWLLRWELRKLQEEGSNYLDAKEELAERHGVSSRTLDRWMNPPFAKK